MKKIYLFFAFVIALAISSKADYYIVGDFTDNSWKPNVAQYTLTYESDGVYSTVANFKVGANGFTLLGKLDEKWENINERYQLDPYDPSLGNRSTEMLTDKEILIKPGSANIFCNYVPAGYYKIIFNTNNMTLKFETIESTDYVYVAGGFAKNWLTQDPFVAAPETSKGSRIYKWYIDCENANDELKISTKLSQKVNEWSGEESFNAGVFALGGKETNGKPIFTTKNDGDWDKNLKLTSKGRYYFTLDLNKNELTIENSYQLHTWVVDGAPNGVLNSLGNKKFDRIDANTCVLSFESPIELASDEEFLLKGYDYFKGSTDAANSWTLKANDGGNIFIKAGEYYNAVVNDAADVTLKFNTYAETTTGLDAVVNSAADYVKVNATLYGHYFDGTYLYASTTENNSSKKNTANEGDKGKGWSDKEENFTQNDWVVIEGLSADFEGKEIAAGSIVELKANDAYPVVKFVASVTPADGKTLTANTYRVANFNIGKDVNAVKYVWLVAPQAGEYCHVTGYVAAADGGKVTLKSAASSEDVKIGETTITVEPVEMTVNYSGEVTTGKWFSFTGIVVKNGETLELNALSAEDVSTGVESVETANATVFAANGTINVSSNAEASIEVYTANGQMVRAINADNASIAVAPGFYLVKVGSQVSKVIVK